MEILQQFIDNSQIQLLTAFLLGLMTAISPCPLATNITAVAYIGQNIENRRRVFINGLLYTLGRGVTYFTLALILFLGASKVHLARFFQMYGEKIMGPLFLIAGLLMLDFIRINLPGVSSLSDRFRAASAKGSPGITGYGHSVCIGFLPLQWCHLFWDANSNDGDFCFWTLFAACICFGYGAACYHLRLSYCLHPIRGWQSLQ